MLQRVGAKRERGGQRRGRQLTSGIPALVRYGRVSPLGLSESARRVRLTPGRPGEPKSLTTTWLAPEPDKAPAARLGDARWGTWPQSSARRRPGAPTTPRAREDTRNRDHKTRVRGAQPPAKVSRRTPGEREPGATRLRRRGGRDPSSGASARTSQPAPSRGGENKVWARANGEWSPMKNPRVSNLGETNKSSLVPEP